MEKGRTGPQSNRRSRPLIPLHRAADKLLAAVQLHGDDFFTEIEAELGALAEGRAVDGDPATVEADVLREQDVIEFTLGEDYFERRKGDWPGGLVGDVAICAAGKCRRNSSD